MDGSKGLNPFDSDEDTEPRRSRERETCEKTEGPGSGRRERSAAEWEDTPLKQRPPDVQLEYHCTTLSKIINETGQLTDPFLLQEFGDHLRAIEKCLSRERPMTKGLTGDCLSVILTHNIIENVYMFSTRQRVHGRDIRIMLLQFFSEVFVHSSQDILIHQQFLRPLNRLLRACEGTKKGEIKDGEISTSLVPLLHQICILIQENQSYLDLFFMEAKAHHPARFFILTQLIPYMHDVSEIGKRSRDALLLCLSLADHTSHASLSEFIAIDSNFCQVLATGLSGLYSDLPTSCRYSVDEWQSPLPVIESSVPELTQFYQALDFCNSVLQISPKVICDQILSLVKEGFLQQVIGPAIFQNSEEAVTVAMAYLTLFLNHITNMSLMREFLRFLIQGKYDGRSVINSILYHITSSNIKTCSVALELVYVLIDFNCEDVMLELVLRHLLPGNHVMHNQIAILARPDIYNQAAKKFLQLIPSSCITSERMFLESIRPKANPSQLSTSSNPDTPSRVGSPPPPPLLTSSPLHSHQPTTTHLERPKPVHLVIPAPNKTNGLPTSTNPFDGPVLPSTPRSRSGSNGSSTGSLVSISSSVSGGHSLNNHTSSQSNTAGTLEFEYVPPAMSYMRNILAARETIATCSARCRCWSNKYDRCLEEACDSQPRVRADSGKSHEMDDVPGRDTVSSKPENEEKSLEKLSAFRTRSVTVSSSYRLPLARTRDTRDITAGNSGTGDSTMSKERDIQSLKRSPRLSRRLEDSRFEDGTGLLLKVLMDKLSEMLSLPPAINIQLTRVIARLAHYPQPLLRSLLLNHQLVLRPGVPNLYYVLQGIKVTVDRHARSQEKFEERLGRARKTMIYRAHIRNAQLEESVASQIVSRLTRQSSALSQIGDSSTTSIENHIQQMSSDSIEEPLPRIRSHTEVQRSKSLHRSTARRTKPKKVSTNSLFAIVIFDEFLKELASLAHEHASFNSSSLPQRTTS